MSAKKSVLQLSIQDEKIRKKALVKVSGFPGVNSVAVDDKTGTFTIIGEVDVSDIVMKLKKICKPVIVSVEDVKPSKKNAESEKPAPPKPDEVFVYPYPINYQQYQYSAPYADYYYQPCLYSRVVVEEPIPYVIL